MATIQISPYTVLDLAKSAQKVLQGKLDSIESNKLPSWDPQYEEWIHTRVGKDIADSLVMMATFAIENSSILGSLVQIDTQEINVLTKYGK